MNLDKAIPIIPANPQAYALIMAMLNQFYIFLLANFEYLFNTVANQLRVASLAKCPTEWCKKAYVIRFLTLTTRKKCFSSDCSSIYYFYAACRRNQ